MYYSSQPEGVVSYGDDEAGIVFFTLKPSFILKSEFYGKKRI
jgi:hypothetical protein